MRFLYCVDNNTLVSFCQLLFDFWPIVNLIEYVVIDQGRVRLIVLDLLLLAAISL